MSRETTLSDLCSICHVKAIKYTCPRCGVHTCSLPCVKKHKQWAQCSGVRDPAEYRKRSELATESSIDKDFNFITKVERGLQRAENDVADRGLNLAPARKVAFNRQRKIDEELEQRAITIVRAPKGLSRSKNNKSHYAPDQKCIMWTLEWVLPDMERITGQMLESKTPHEGFENACKKNNRPLRKRKRDEAEVDGLRSKDNLPDETPASTQVVPDACHFYLHIPNTTSKTICVAVMDPSKSMKDQFDRRRFNEYPTIYVRTEPPGQLPDQFVLEEVYKDKKGVEIPVNITSSVNDPPTSTGENILNPNGVDAEKIMAVLAQDLVS